jgi:putative addiction module killer protein
MKGDILFFSIYSSSELRAPRSYISLNLGCCLRNLKSNRAGFYDQKSFFSCFVLLIFQICPICRTLPEKVEGDMLYEIYTAREYDDWFDDQQPKVRSQIENRLYKIMVDGHWGDCKRLDSDIWELRWENGRRIYYAYLTDYNLLMLIGGNKNGQSKDITQAKKVLRKRATEAFPIKRRGSSTKA